MYQVGIHQPLRVLTLVMLSMLLFAGGCATQSRHSQTLEDTLLAYEKVVRWGDMNVAMNFLHPDHLPEPRTAPLMMKRFEQIRVVGYLVTGKGSSADKDTFLQTAEISFENLHTKAVRSIKDPQVWRYDRERERWLLTSGLPDITRR